MSNFKINYNKSEMLPLYMPQIIEDSLKQSFSFTWNKLAIKYSGTNLTADLSNSYEEYYIPPLQKIRGDLGDWDRAALSWLGRVNSLKMGVLQKCYLQCK